MTIESDQFRDYLFTDLSHLVSELMGSIWGLFVKILHWNLNTIESSRSHHSLASSRSGGSLIRH